jgi:hypothetical protein
MESQRALHLQYYPQDPQLMEAPSTTPAPPLVFLFPLFTLTLRTPTVFLTLPLSLLPPLIYLSHTSSHATSSTPPVIFNILSLSLAHTALTTLKLDRFMTGAVLLSGLFLYDVFWVFGSEKLVGRNVVSLPTLTHSHGDHIEHRW